MYVIIIILVTFWFIEFHFWLKRISKTYQTLLICKNAQNDECIEMVRCLMKFTILQGVKTTIAILIVCRNLDFNTVLIFANSLLISCHALELNHFREMIFYINQRCKRSAKTSNHD